MSSLERLSVGSLGRLTQIAQGGQARIHLAPDLKIPGEKGQFVFKEYKSKTFSAGGLDGIVQFRGRLSDEERQRLDVIANWPVRVVESDSGQAAGVVLPLITDEYFHTLHLPNGDTTRALRDGQYLSQPVERCERVGLSLVSLGDRYRVARDMAFAMGFLHRRGVCLGDISFGNAVYSLEVSPCVYLADCDAFRFRGQAAVVSQLHTPDWLPPEGSSIQSQRTDEYKLGLFILRVLTPRALSAQNRDPAWADQALPPRGRVLLRRALGDGKTQPRTTAKEWFQFFNETLKKMRPPVTRSKRRLSPPTTVTT